MDSVPNTSFSLVSIAIRFLPLCSSNLSTSTFKTLDEQEEILCWSVKLCQYQFPCMTSYIPSIICTWGPSKQPNRSARSANSWLFLLSGNCCGMCSSPSLNPVSSPTHEGNGTSGSTPSLQDPRNQLGDYDP